MDKRYHYITPDDFMVAEKNGINSAALQQRVRDYGWDIDRAIIVPLKVETPFQPIWEKWEKIATKHGVSRVLFYHRVKKGWPEAKSATFPIKRGKPLSDEWTEEEREIARRNGLDKNYMNAVKARINLGWTREEALNTPKLTENERAKRIAEGTRAYHERRKGVK